MPGQRSFEGGSGSFGVTDLTDQDDVGILPERRTKRRVERQIGSCIHLNLPDTVDAVFDRIFNRDDVERAAAQFVHERIKRRRLPAPGGTGDDNDSLWSIADGPQACFDRVSASETRQRRKFFWSRKIRITAASPRWVGMVDKRASTPHSGSISSPS